MAIENSELDLIQDQNKNDERYLVPGLVRGLAILKLFDRNHQEMTISEIAEKIEVNRSSAFRLIHTLESCGYLKKMSQKTYSLDNNVMELGFNSLSQLSLNELASPVMRELRDQVKIAVHLSVLEGCNVVFINNIQSISAFSSNVNIGTRWPAHATVIGQLMLSRLKTEEVVQRYESFKEWTVFSDLTPRNLTELLKRLEAVKQESVMVSWGHFNTDMAACAVPIFNQANHEVIAVLSVSCPITTYTQDEFYNIVAKKVMTSANIISNFIYK